MQQVCLLGATGSIGLQTLDIVDQHPEKFNVFALSAHSQVEKTIALIQKFKPAFVVMVQESAAQKLQAWVETHDVSTKILSGPEALDVIASHETVTTVVAGITGAAGLSSVLAAAKSGKKLLLANKEALVMTGPLLMGLIEKHHATLLPLDSEHNALFQCLKAPYVTGTTPIEVDKMILTASGGPFLHYKGSFEDITPELAAKHPNWSMGINISIDSATLMNKGLEVIEAHFLFNMAPEKIEVVIHPESIIHSMVVYKDGSYLAQMGSHDMRIPISYGLGWPERLENRAPGLDLTQIGRLHFEAPDLNKFPCLKHAFWAMKTGGTAPVVLNASNEVARLAFIEKRLKFNEIPVIIEKTLNTVSHLALDSLETVFEVDKRARQIAQGFCG